MKTKVGRLEVWAGSVMDVLYPHETIEDGCTWTTTYRMTYILSQKTGELKMIDSNLAKIPPQVLAEVDQYKDKLKTIFLLGRK